MVKGSTPLRLVRASTVPATLSALVLALASVPSLAQEEIQQFDIEAPSLGAALLELSRQSGVTIVVAPELTRGTPPRVLKARLSPDEALQRLLDGTGLRAVRSPSGGYVIERAPVTLTRTALQVTEPQSAAASTQPSARQSAAETLIETVVVTARKKSAAENAQEVPISLSAVSGEQIEAQFAKDLTDVGQRMPNVRLDTVGVFPGIANYAIRGTGYVSGIASTEPTVGVFVDGVYLGVNLGGAPDTFDLESVEVLRGPQGTLFGRNVTGGAVVMRSRRPDGDFRTGVRVGAGSGDRYSGAGSIEGSITETLSAKLFASYSERGGDFDNVFLNDEHGEERTTFVRPILRWRPNADVDIATIFEHGETKGDGPFSRILNDPASSAYINNGIREPRGTDNLSINHAGKTDIEWDQIVLDANWNVGGGTLTSITGYRDVSYYSSGDGDGSSAEISTGITWTDQDQFSEELRFASQAFDGKLDYTIGLYYFEQQMDQQYRLNLFGNPIFLTNGELDHKTASAFAQGDYEFLPGAYLTAGLRYTWERKRAKIARGNNCDTSFNCTFPFRDSQEWNNLSPKLGLSWKITDDVLAYASWTKGFRSGGYNTRTTGATESPGPYDEEIVRSYEVGLKSEFWNRRARVNLAVFHDKYSDLQRTVFDPVLFSNRIANAASAKVDGAELDVSLLPLDGLALTASVGYLDARYVRFDSLDVTGDSIPDPELAKGLQLIRAPDWTYSISATYDMNLGTAGSLISRAAYSYSAASPLNDANTRRLDSYGLFDASVTWTRRMTDDEFSVSLWGKNLTNEKYGLTGATSVLFTSIYQGLPRTWGVEFSYRR